jgi:hypothetical protein
VVLISTVKYAGSPSGANQSFRLLRIHDRPHFVQVHL